MSSMVPNLTPSLAKDPWHLRQPTTAHYQWFQNLVDLHELTGSWLKEIESERASHNLTRGLSRHVLEDLWMLDSISNKNLEFFLDDTAPAEMLARLEHAVWAVHAWTLTHIRAQSKGEAAVALESLLEQISWKAGRECAQKRWKPLINPLGNSLGLRDILFAFHDSPCLGFPQREPYLIRRATVHAIDLELLSCPHQLPYHEVTPAMDRLCELHWHFLRGFAYALNSRVSSEMKIDQPRCIHRWELQLN